MISDACVPRLCRLPTLAWVAVGGSGLTRHGKQWLRTATRRKLTVWDGECLKCSFQMCNVVSNRDLKGQVLRVVAPPYPAGPAGKIAWW